MLIKLLPLLFSIFMLNFSNSQELTTEGNRICKCHDYTNDTAYKNITDTVITAIESEVKDINLKPFINNIYKNFVSLKDVVFHENRPEIIFSTMESLWNILFTFDGLNLTDTCRFYTKIDKMLDLRTNLGEFMAHWIRRRLENDTGERITYLAGKAMKAAFLNGSYEKVQEVINIVNQTRKAFLISAIRRFDFNELAQIFVIYNSKEFDNIFHNNMIPKQEVNTIIKYFLIKDIKLSVLNGTYDQKIDVVDLIYFANEDLFVELLNGIIQDLSPTMKLSDILHNLWLHSLTYQRALILISLFHNLKDKMDKNDLDTHLLAYYFFKLKEFDDLSYLSLEKIDEIHNCMDKFPQLVQKLYLSNYGFICLKNALRNTYAAAGSLSLEFAKHEGVVNGLEENREAALWFVIPVDEYTIKLRSKIYPEEYLFAADEKGDIFKRRRRVFTLGDQNESSLWHFYGIDNNQVIIKSKKYDEFLCAHNWYDSNAGDLVTRDLKHPRTSCRWFVEIC